MRSVNLAKVAIQSEILRYKAMAARQGRRAAFSLLALIFGFGFLITLEIAIWQVLRMYILPIYATLCLLGFNLLIAVAFGFVAMRSSPSRAEIDALDVRKTAVKALQRSLTMGALVPVTGMLWRRRAAIRNTVARRR